MKWFLPWHPADEELVRAIDDALEAGPSPRTLAHLSTCASCQRRRDVLEDAMLATAALLRSDRPAHGVDQDVSRAAFERRLSTEKRRIHQEAARWPITPAALARWSTAVVLVAAVLITARAVRSRSQAVADVLVAPIDRDALPIASVTPGATADFTLDQVCRGEHGGIEPADPAVRLRILQQYGMTDVPQHEYELDYLITPELGGANDERNLWPERYTDRRWNAKVKDQLEDLLPRLVCQGTIDLHTAQQDIAANWVEAYKKYLKTDVPLRAIK